MDIQDCISIEETRGVVCVILPRAFGLLPKELADRLQADWPNVPDRIHDAATDRIIGILRQKLPDAKSFRIVGPKRRGGGDAAAAGGGAGGADPDVAIQ